MNLPTEEIKTPDISLRLSYSEFIKTKFKADETCPYCYGFGIMMRQPTPNAPFQYLPCGCLRNL